MSPRIPAMRNAVSNSWIRILLLVLLLAVPALWLGAVSSCAMSADVGVTPGGQKDIAAARSVIEEGGIPDPGWITVEGFLSEHSIPIDEPQDAGLLYSTASASWNADYDVFTPVATVVIGFGTTLDRETFTRDPLNLCLVIDRSGSMGDMIDERTSTSKLDAVKIAVDRLLGQLTSEDRVSLVDFNTRTKLWFGDVVGEDIATIKSALDQITAGGGTDLADGMRRGYRAAWGNHAAGRSDRLIVFTDALLKDRAEAEVRSFLGVMGEYAEHEVGATIFGVGTDFGHEVAYDISQIRGGNYFFLSDYDRIVTVFDEEFDYLVTPVAYDVSLVVSVPYEWDVESVYGIQVEEPFPHLLDLEIPTLFLSTRQGGGATLVRLRPGALVDFSTENTIAEIAFSYTTTEGTVQTAPAVTALIPGGFDAQGTVNYFENDGTRRAVLLLNSALVLRNACQDVYVPDDDYGYYWYGYDPTALTQAIDRLTDFLPYFDRLAEGLEDAVSESSRTLSQERALLVRLLTNLQAEYDRLQLY